MLLKPMIEGFLVLRAMLFTDGRDGVVVEFLFQVEQIVYGISFLAKME